MTRFLCSRVFVTIAVVASLPTLAAQQPVPKPEEQRRFDSIFPVRMIDSMRRAAMSLEPGWNLPPAVPRDDPKYIGWLQESLNRVIQPGLEVSGVEGSRTQDAVRRFQRQQGLKADGVVGPETELALVMAQGRSLLSSPIPGLPSLRPSGRLGGRRPFDRASDPIGDSVRAQLGREFIASSLRADLRSLAEAESIYYLTHNTFATALTSLSPSVRIAAGTDLYLGHADSATWRASAKSLLSSDIVCSIAGQVRSSVPQSPAKIDCSGL